MNRIFVFEESDLLRPIVVETIGFWAGFEVCGEAATAEEAYARIPACRPDIVLVDMAFPQMTGVELVRRLIERQPELTCILIVPYDARWLCAQAREAGAAGYVVKGDLPRSAVEQVLREDHRRARLHPMPARRSAWMSNL